MDEYLDQSDELIVLMAIMLQTLAFCYTTIRIMEEVSLECLDFPI